MRKTTKPARKPVRKAAAVKRVREGKQARARIKPEVLEEAAPTQPEFDFDRLGCTTKAVGPEPPPPAVTDRAQGQEAKAWQCERVSRSNLASTMEGYREGYGPEANCGDAVALLLSYRTLDDIEIYVYEKTGKAYPGLNPGHRRMNCGNIIRGLVSRRDADCMGWLLDTNTRS